jgi:hypothetical protein
MSSHDGDHDGRVGPGGKHAAGSGPDRVIRPILTRPDGEPAVWIAANGWN